MDIPNEASWCWHNILKCRGQASSLIVHSIGDGKDTKLWKDPWHPMGILLNRFPQHLTYHSSLHCNATVSALIHNGKWDIDRHGRTTLADICDDLGMVEMDTKHKDVVTWMGGQAGEFSNKSAYHSMRSRTQSISWSKLVWFRGRTPRQSFITWLAMHKALKTQDKLLKWKVIERSICPLCRDEPECEEHLLFKCRYSSFIWTHILILLGYKHQAMNWATEWRWCELKFSGTSSNSVLKRLALNATTYHLWTERNCRLFQSKFRVAIEVETKIIKDVRLRASVLDLQVEDNADNRQLFDKWRFDMQFFTRTITMHAWQRPEQGWFKVNSDGSLTGTIGGYGALIRDHDGLVVTARAGSQRAQTILLHELQGIELGIKLAQRYALHRVELSMDSNMAFKYLSTDKVPSWEAIHITRRIREALNKFAGCRIMHAVRETNQAADKLAKLLPSHEFLEIIPSSFAEDIKKIVFDDARGS